MYYIKPKREKKKVCRNRWLIVGAVCITAVLGNTVLTEMIYDTALTISKNEAAVAVNYVVADIVEEKGYTYEDFIEISKGEDGSVCSVSAKSEAVNTFKSELAGEVKELLRDSEFTEISVPLGTLTDIGILYGRGPNIRIKLRFYGGVTARLESSFISVGINQTRHRITCIVSADLTVITPSFSENIKIESEYLIAETIIVGEIPDSYTNVNGDDSGIIGQIFDYADIG